MPDLFASPRSMIRWAKKHINNLEAEIKSFSDAKDWTNVIEKDTDGTHELHKIKFGKRISDDMPNIIFDAASNLRATLDQMAFAIAVKHTGLDRPKSAKFPFGPTEAEMRNNAAGACKDLPPDVQTLFMGFKPYEAGNFNLWALNELCNTPKHMMLMALSLGGGVTRLSGKFSGPTEILGARWNPENHDITFMRTGPGATVEYDLSVTFPVVLNCAQQSLRNYAPATLLRAVAADVETVLADTEAVCRRIRLIS